MADPHCRIGRVHFKAGGATLTLLPNHAEQSRERCRKRVLEAIDAAEDVGGYALVIWSPDGGSVCCFDASRSHIPSILIPDFVRNRLLAQRIEGWTLETVNETWGG